MAAVVVLVVGLRPVDAGKTTLAGSLTRHLRALGVDAAAIKPVGSAEAWLHPEALRVSGEHGVLVTPDALRLSAAQAGVLPLDAVEPVAALHAPPDPSRWDWSPQPYQALLSDPNRTAALLRVTSCTPQGRASVHAYNVQALERAPGQIAERLSDLARRLRPPAAPIDEDGVEALLGPRAMAAADSCLALLRERGEALVVESFSDVAAPTPGSLAADLVVAVAPGVAAIIDGARYRKAVLLRGGHSNPTLVPAVEAVQLAGVAARVELPLLEEPEEGYSRGDIEGILEHVSARLRR